VTNPQLVIALGGVIEFYRLLDQFGSLFRIFANKARTPAGVLDFIAKFGPLTGDGLNPKRGEPVSDVIKHASSMYELLTLRSGKRLASKIGPLGVQLTKINVSLVGDRITESLKLQLWAETLIEGLWLQFWQALSGGATIEQCLHCSDLFETALGTGRRLGAKFCSDNHRIAFNSRKRSPAR
jgi:hypothetical protein